jgi:AcrR family transcriptional regulator
MSMGITGRGQVEAVLPPPSERHLRADAQRNRERILEAATTLMAAHGIDVPIDEIAQRAQVGVGTVYRNFPTKEALFEALIHARLEPLVAEARSAATSEDSADAFINFIRRIGDEFADFKALGDAMCEAGIDLAVTKQRISGELNDAVAGLLASAQRAGRIRPDVTINDVSAMMAGLSHADPSLMDSSQRKRCVALVCDSLLIDARSVLPKDELVDSEPARA